MFEVHTLTRESMARENIWMAEALDLGSLQAPLKDRHRSDPERARRLLSSAERCCSTLQTMRRGVEVSTTFDLG